MTTQAPADLQQQRRQLAYAASQGDHAAQRQLEQIEAQLNNARIAGERQALVDQEAERLAAEAAAAAEAARRQSLAQQQRELSGQRRRDYGAIQRSMTVLTEAIEQAKRTASELEATEIALNLSQGAQRDTQFTVMEFIAAQLIAAGLPLPLATSAASRRLAAEAQEE